MKINIAYSCNEAYVHHTGISILSLLENNKDVKDITIFFIQKDVKDESIVLLTKLVNSFGREIKIISFDNLCPDLKVNSLGRHIETIYAKLFFSRIEDIDKILYIDSDTIINASLKDLWEIELEDNWVAGVETFTVNSKSMLNLNKEDAFINDGVVIVNLKEFRKQNILQKFISCIEEYNGNPPLLSEGVINKVCKGKIKILNPQYNLLSGLIDYKRDRFANISSYYDKKTIKNAIKTPVIIHFLSSFYNRPWDINCSHPMKNYYLYYKNKSFWKHIPLENKRLSTRLRLIGFLYKIIPHDFLDFLRFLKLKLHNTID